MATNPEIERLADALRVSVSLFIRRARQLPKPGDLTLAETAAIKRIELHGPMTLTALAKLEEISAQSMGATITTLEERGFITRSPDPGDGRQTIVALSKSGRGALQDRRNAFTQQIAAVLETAFSEAERKKLAAVTPLIERLAQHL